MAAGVLPRPGTDYGPCERECGHRDCKATREQAASPCPICGAAIEYDRPFYSTDRGLEHAFCAEKEAERARP